MGKYRSHGWHLILFFIVLYIFAVFSTGIQPNSFWLGAAVGVLLSWVFWLLLFQDIRSGDVTMNEIHDFDGPYQIHTTHDGHRLVFVKGVYETFDMSSERLSKIVQQKINDATVELTKWKALQKVLWDV